jgi:glycosyltransferase 2 family protein
MARGRILRIVVGIGLGSFLAFLSARKVAFADIVRALSGARWSWMIAVLVLTFVVLFLRTVRWGMLLAPAKRLSNRVLFPSLMIGYMTNNVLPLRAGEFIRAYHLGAKGELPKSTVFASILVERIIDVWTVFILLCVGASFVTVSRDAKNLLRSGAILSGVLLVILFVLGRQKERMVGLARRLLRKTVPRFAERGERVFRAFADGADLLGSASRLLSVMAMSLAIWIMGSVIVYCTGLALHVGLPAWGAPVVLAVIALGITVPTSPGDIGTYQFFSLLGLSIFGIPKASALTFSIILQASQYIPTTVVGLLFVVRESIGFAGIRRMAWKTEKQIR